MANWVNEELYTYDMYGNQTGVEVYEINEEITSSEKAGDVRYSYDESNQMVQYETKGVEETEWTQAARNVYNGEGDVYKRQDTFKGDVYSPWTQNLYTYTSNNPVDYIDPTGHYYETVLGGIGEA